MDNNQIFRNWFVIFHRHVTKVLAQIIQCIILERNDFSIVYNTIYSLVIFPDIKIFFPRSDIPGCPDAAL